MLVGGSELSAIIVGAVIFIMAAALVIYACCLSPPVEKMGAEIFYDPLEQDVRYYERKMEKLEND